MTSRARQVDDQPAGEDRGRLRGVRIDTLLPAIRAYRPQSEPLRRLEDPDRLEVGGFEEDLLGRLRHLAFLPAHDRRERDRLLAVRDHQVARVELPQRPVERAELLARVCAPDDDPAVGEQGAVERVQR